MNLWTIKFRRREPDWAEPVACGSINDNEPQIEDKIKYVGIFTFNVATEKDRETVEVIYFSEQSIEMQARDEMRAEFKKDFPTVGNSFFIEIRPKSTCDSNIEETTSGQKIKLKQRLIELQRRDTLALENKISIETAEKMSREEVERIENDKGLGVFVEALHNSGYTAYMGSVTVPYKIQTATIAYTTVAQNSKEAEIIIRGKVQKDFPYPNFVYSLSISPRIIDKQKGSKPEVVAKLQKYFLDLEKEIVVEEPKEDKVSYISTVAFKKPNNALTTLNYITDEAENIESAREILENRFKNDFPYPDLNYSFSVAIRNHVSQCETKEGTIKKLQNELAEQHVIINEPELDISEEEPIIQEPIKQEPVKQENVWFVDFNIKIDTEKFRKGFIINGVDNIVDAKKQCEIRAKKEFSRIRSMNKFELNLWDGIKEEYSEKIVENVPVRAATTVSNSTSKKASLEEIINKAFTEEDLDKMVWQVVVKGSKVKPKDFDEGFLVSWVQDKDETEADGLEHTFGDRELYGKKGVAVRKVKYKNILVTTQYKRVIMSKEFQEEIEKGRNGVDVLHDMYLDIHNPIKSKLQKIPDKYQRKILKGLESKISAIDPTLLKKVVGIE